MTTVADPDILQALGMIYTAEWSEPVRQLLFAPRRYGAEHALEDVLAELEGSDSGLGHSLLPLCVVDEGSLALVVLQPPSGGGPPAGAVLRWFLAPVDDAHQLELLDVHPLLYVASLEEELRARPVGLSRILDEIGPAYEAAYIKHEKRPRDFVVRPVRIACQNVIVGLAAIAQDTTFDGLSVPAWQTCELPHVATHEGNRALAALMLCDAFQNGGTMEIRFDKPASVSVDGHRISYTGHPEGNVPASLRRYGRTVGVALGSDLAASISPQEARELFLAVTPMPDRLRERVLVATETRGISPERICFTLLAQTWREIEVDFLLSCSPRASSILEGGADWRQRGSRQAEMEVCRAALMVGMYFRRLNGRDSAGDTEGVRVVEDLSAGVQWNVLESQSAVEFDGADLAEGVPWRVGQGIDSPTQITVVPRASVTDETISELRALRADGVPAVLLLPLDVPMPSLHSDLPVLRCPDRRADLDLAVEAKLLTSRISRG